MVTGVDGNTPPQEVEIGCRLAFVPRQGADCGTAAPLIVVAFPDPPPVPPPPPIGPICADEIDAKNKRLAIRFLMFYTVSMEPKTPSLALSASMYHLSNS